MIASNQKATYIGLGELAVCADSAEVLTSSGLGSCIALCIFDPVRKIGGMAHMLLPRYQPGYEISSSPSKYVDAGTKVLLARLAKNGSNRQNLIVKIAGGARILSIPGDENRLDIGQRNIAEIRATLQKENLKICGEDVGGGFSRSVYLFIESGKTIVRSVSGKVIEL